MVLFLKEPRNTIMTIPPFPSQDLAKLVLGYLAEEQLMTAYDEFLQASPYLDALRNEYDRIFMTSLKSILAEYRAVKIYVDTCKPFALRKKIFQCTNLLDVVKFLVINVDINKIQLQDAIDKASLEKQNVNITLKSTCALCFSLKLANCVCKSKTDVQQTESVPVSYVDGSTVQNSVETTPLEDLPGNHITTRKKHVKVLEKESASLSSNTSSIQYSDSSAKQSFSSHISPEEYLAKCENSLVLNTVNDSSLSLDSTVKAVNPSKSKQNIEEFNNVLKSVVNRNKTLSGSECPTNQRISNASTFQDFASGVSSGENHNATYNVPDSSTSENLNVRASLTKNLYNDNIKGPPQHQLLLQVSHVNDNIEIQTCRGESSKPLKAPKFSKLPKIKPKPTEAKIKIISDVKVSSKNSDNSDSLNHKPLVSQNATSTPLMQMQTITINGTPAYKHTPKTHAFTKDEIMAMPTLIVVPASGPSQIPTSAHCEPIMTQNSNVVSKASSSPRVLGPLVIDVQPNTHIDKPIVTALPDLSDQSTVENGVVKTVDVKNATVPKDNVISTESNTPQVLPPTRKSSSTPRRSSHIRVLDFTTPRRILHETINEQVSSQSSDPPVEIILSSPNVVSTQTTSENVGTISDKIAVVTEEGNNNDSGSTKENDSENKIKQVKKHDLDTEDQIIQVKKYDWDADLRALVANDKKDTVSHRKPKRASKKKKSIDKVAESDKTESNRKSHTKKSPRVKKTKIRRKVKEEDDEPPPNLDKSDVPGKPSIKIIGYNYHGKTEQLQDNRNDIEYSKNKSHEKDDENIDTPEAERLSLQNVIGAKLNISDLLETPYKQALYDIQMETPRFLGPDLPDEPLSDIKIMNIPTPRFLNTPKPAQATPSSYSSRPTDYSSGGSYYKPDDQDYMPIPDIIMCPVTSSKEDIRGDRSTEKDNDEKKSRPVRQCTKNVSYYKNYHAVNKIKDAEDNIDATSSCSDGVSVNSSVEFKNKNDTTSITPQEKSESLSRTESIKRNSTRRIKKTQKDSTTKDATKDTSTKNKSKSFMKIKPRYTPKKETPSGRNRKKLIQSPHSKGSPSLQRRKRTTSREKTVHGTPLIVPVSTKSRRKSSTPRKLHCTKTFTSESSGHNSPELVANIKPCENHKKSISNPQDSHVERTPLQMSSVRSQDTKAKDILATANEIEDITKIQEFIDSSDVNKQISINDGSKQENLKKNKVCIESNGTLQRDLMKRGFDLETAKIIERDLLDDSPLLTESSTNMKLPMVSVEIVETKKEDSSLEKTSETEEITNELQVQYEMDDDEIEFSVHECNEESKNYFVFEHDDAKEISQGPPIKLKDNFTMEVCIDEVTLRLRVTPFKLVHDQDPLTVDEIDYSYKETERAVSSIINMDRLYTPLKDSIKAQCYEIFDSTLTSIDTPLKAISPVKTNEITVTDLVLEREAEAKSKTETKKRKRLPHSSDETVSNIKRKKPDADLLLKTANIQNIDIETVLTKLHGH